MTIVEAIIVLSSFIEEKDLWPSQDLQDALNLAVSALITLRYIQLNNLPRLETPEN